MNAISNIDDITGTWTGEMFAELLLEKEEYKDHDLLMPYRKGGIRSDNPYVNFYWDYCSQGKPCYVKIDYQDINEAIALVKDNGGVAVLAHPGNNLKGKLELFDEILKTGIDGVEVFCSYHNEKETKYFYDKTKEHSKIITCGSDFHGKTKPSVRLGSTGCWIEHENMIRHLGVLLNR